MRRKNLVLCVAVLASVGVSVQVASAQLPSYHVGRAPTAEELKALDTYVGPNGKGLPTGKGTAKEGAVIFGQKCALCHGASGNDGKYPKLVDADMHPFATTYWSMINSSMPRSVPDVGVRAETLKTDEVYALTAFLLWRNKVIAEDTVVDQNSLPRIKMPVRDKMLDKLVPAP
jgi:S-disulfanyl-L-cysteine oxidoreductase SoxD